MRWRGVPRPDVNKVKTIMTEFDERYETIAKIARQAPGSQEAMDKIYRQLCDINGIGPKSPGLDAYLRLNPSRVGAREGETGVRTYPGLP